MVVAAESLLITRLMEPMTQLTWLCVVEARYAIYETQIIDVMQARPSKSKAGRGIGRGIVSAVGAGTRRMI